MCIFRSIGVTKGKCLEYNYVGHGYSREFEINMAKIKAALDGGGAFTLVTGRDDVCAACPFDHGGVCETEEKVARYDNRVIDMLGLKPGETYRYTGLSDAVREKIFDGGKLSDVCGDCEWHELRESVIDGRK